MKFHRKTPRWFFIYPVGAPLAGARLLKLIIKMNKIALRATTYTQFTKKHNFLDKNKNREHKTLCFLYLLKYQRKKFVLTLIICVNQNKLESFINIKTRPLIK